MAFSTTAAAGDYVSQGAVGVRGTFTTKRKYSLSDKIVYQDRMIAKFDNVLRMEGKVISVNDPEPKVLTKLETPVSFAVKSDGADTTYEGDTVYISDTLAKFLQAGDVLMNQSLFCDSDGANFSTTKYASGYTQENMTVESVMFSGASAGVSKILVRRGNGQNTAAVAAGTVSTILSEHKLIHMGNALADGGNAPTAIQHEPNSVQDYLQLFSKVAAETETEENMEVYGKETMAQKVVRKRKELLRQIELSHFLGRAAKPTVSGQTKWLTGGLAEFVPGATTALDGVTRFIDFGGAFDFDSFREKCEIIYRYGSEVKHWFCGGKFYSVLLNHLDKFIRLNDGYSKKYGWQVQELETGHGVAILHRHSLQTELANTQTDYGFDCFVVDLEYVDLMVMQNMDIRVKADVQDRDEHAKKVEIYGQVGLRRTFPTAHAILYGITG